MAPIKHLFYGVSNNCSGQGGREGLEFKQAFDEQVFEGGSMSAILAEVAGGGEVPARHGLRSIVALEEVSCAVRSARLQAVVACPERAVLPQADATRPIVRPDRPSSVNARPLRAVEAAGGAMSGAVGGAIRGGRVGQWKRVAITESTARAARVGRSVQTNRFVSLERATWVAAALAFAAVALAAGIFLASVLGIGVQAGGSILAQPGDSLWSIAASMDTGFPTEKVVSDLAELNGSSQITAGQEILLPAY